MTTPKERLEALGLALPVITPPLAAYVATQRSDHLLFVSGQLPMKNGTPLYKGLVGKDVTLEQAQACAQLCGLHILAQVEAAIGLGKVGQCLKLTGFVASTQDFIQQPPIINGASQLLVDVLGEKGRHARSAISVASLPLGAPVEVEAIFAL